MEIIILCLLVPLTVGHACNLPIIILFPYLKKKRKFFICGLSYIFLIRKTFQNKKSISTYIPVCLWFLIQILYLHLETVGVGYNIKFSKLKIFCTLCLFSIIWFTGYVFKTSTFFFSESTTGSGGPRAVLSGFYGPYVGAKGWPGPSYIWRFYIGSRPGGVRPSWDNQMPLTPHLFRNTKNLQINFFFAFFWIRE